jgi:hypothetical protein
MPIEQPTEVMTPTEEMTPTVEPPGATPEAPASAYVSFVNAVPDSQTFDLYINREMNNSLPFFQATDYLEVPAGEHLIQMVPAGADPLSDAGVSATIMFEPDTAYTVAGIGLVEDGSAALRVLIDDLSAPPPGRARLSIYHFSPDAPAVDVALADGTVLFPNLAFGNGAEIEVDAGTYDIVVNVSESGVNVLNLPGTTVEAGNIYDVFAVDVASNLRAELRVVSPIVAAPAPAVPSPEPMPTAPVPAPQPQPTPTPQIPVALPETSDGQSLPTTPLALAAVLMIAAGALVLALRKRLS